MMIKNKCQTTCVVNLQANLLDWLFSCSLMFIVLNFLNLKTYSQIFDSVTRPEVTRVWWSKPWKNQRRLQFRELCGTRMNATTCLLATTVVILWGTYVWVKYTHRSPGLLTRTRTRHEVDAARKRWSRSCARVFCPLLCRSLFEKLSYISRRCTLLLLLYLMHGIVLTVCCLRYEMLFWTPCWIN